MDNYWLKLSCFQHFNAKNLNFWGVYLDNHLKCTKFKKGWFTTNRLVICWSQNHLTILLYLLSFGGQHIFWWSPAKLNLHLYGLGHPKSPFFPQVIGWPVYSIRAGSPYLHNFFSHTAMGGQGALMHQTWRTLQTSSFSHFTFQQGSTGCGKTMRTNICIR